MTNTSMVLAFKAVINDKSIRNRAKACLGENSGAFISSMLDLYSGDQYLQKCDPHAVAMECLKAASLHLPIVKGLGFAYVVPYKNVPQFIIGWKGLVQLAQRTGQYACINADAVYEGEDVRRNRLTGQIEITGSPTEEKAIGYFAYFRLVNGFEKMLYMTRKEVDDYAKRYSKAYSTGPWKTEFDAMAKKTLLRQLLKYGPMSTEMQKAEEYETMAAQSQAQAEVDANANRQALDLPETPYVEVDESTGEVIGEVPEPAPGGEPEDDNPGF